MSKLGRLGVVLARLAEPDAAAGARIDAPSGASPICAAARFGRASAQTFQAHPGIWGTSWAADGRATFEYREEIRGEPHISWRRIETHDVFRRP